VCGTGPPADRNLYDLKTKITSSHLSKNCRTTRITRKDTLLTKWPSMAKLNWNMEKVKSMSIE